MEVETFQQQALFVREPDEDFDPSAEPQDGEQYLMKVVHERKKCPAIVVKPIAMETETSQEAGKLSPMQLSDELVDASVYLHPSDEWKHQRVKEFSKLRMKVAGLRKGLETHGYTSDINPPLTRDPELWEVFCRNNPPLLSTILRIEQRSLENLIEQLAHWLSEYKDEGTVDLMTSEHWLGTWIHSVLVCLHLPLEPEVHSSLRNVAKTCVTLRNKLGADDGQRAAPLNLFIVLISVFFRQLDLAKYI